MREEFTPVYDLDYEKLLTACMFIYPNSVPTIIEELNENDFFDPKSKIIFHSVKELYKNMVAIDMSTVYKFIVKNGYDVKYNILSNYFFEVQDMPVTITNLDSYILTIKELSIRRESAKYFRDKSIECTNFTNDIGDIIGEVSNKSTDMMVKLIGDTSSKPISDIVKESSKEMHNRIGLFRGGKPPGIATNLTVFDKFIGGLTKGEVLVLAGRPGQGKTAFALYLAKIASLTSHKILFFSLEMSSTSLVDRLIVSISKVSSNGFKIGSLTNGEIDTVEMSINDISKLDIHIDDKADVDVSYIKATSNILKSKGKCDLIIIDYLQLIGSKGKSFSRENEVSKISRTIKIIAKELNVPIVLLSQLNRQNESRPDKRPILSDLRESGSIEQDADKVVFIHRPEYYGLDDAEPNVTELIIAKNRNGRTGIIKIKHTDALTDYYDY